jgi:hypothetical protein
MDANTFQIDNLYLRIPGLTTQEAHQVANEAAERLAARLPERLSALHLGALDLRLTVPRGTPLSRVTDLIVEAILKRIG